MRRKDLAQTMATALFETEAAMDLALEKAALLIAQSSRLRRDHGYSAVLGHKAIAAMTRSIESLGQAREHAMIAHAAFADAAPLLGVSASVLHGTGVGKPVENPQPTGRLATFSVVDQAA